MNGKDDDVRITVPSELRKERTNESNRTEQETKQVEGKTRRNKEQRKKMRKKGGDNKEVEKGGMVTLSQEQTRKHKESPNITWDKKPKQREEEKGKHKKESRKKRRKGKTEKEKTPHNREDEHVSV